MFAFCSIGCQTCGSSILLLDLLTRNGEPCLREGGSGAPLGFPELMRFEAVLLFLLLLGSPLIFEFLSENNSSISTRSLVRGFRKLRASLLLPEREVAVEARAPQSSCSSEVRSPFCEDSSEKWSSEEGPSRPFGEGSVVLPILPLARSRRALRKAFLEGSPLCSAEFPLTVPDEEAAAPMAVPWEEDDGGMLISLLRWGCSCSRSVELPASDEDEGEVTRRCFFFFLFLRSFFFFARRVLRLDR